MKYAVWSMKKGQEGQVIIIMLLIMVVALALGLAIVGHSISDISTSTKTEDSARAYSAAEAGIERALVSSTDSQSAPTPFLLGNSAQAVTTWSRNLPNSTEALEYPPYGKESFAHFWLANPREAGSGSNPVAKHYDQDSFDLYFGVPKDYQATVTDLDNQPAVEVHVVLARGNLFESRKVYVDSYNGSGAGRSSNGFIGCTESDRDGAVGGFTVNTLSNGRTTPSNFYCKVNINYRSVTDRGSVYPVLARVRILYTSMAHPVALKPTGSCGGNQRDCSLPVQVSIYKSVGSSGNTERELELFQQHNVVPYMFDYVLFSSGELSK
jgi:hypothetical protein